jgi:hypothetical protein
MPPHDILLLQSRLFGAVPAGVDGFFIEGKKYTWGEIKSTF